MPGLLCWLFLALGLAAGTALAIPARRPLSHKTPGHRHARAIARRAEGSRVRVARLPAGTPFSRAKAEGVRQARGRIVALLEEHCRAAPGWAAALAAAHRGPWAAVGAEVHNANPGSWVSRVVAVMNYHPWLAPAPRREHAMLPGHNSSFRRDLLLAYGAELPRMLRALLARTARHLDRRSAAASP